jgi:hypothetical protein
MRRMRESNYEPGDLVKCDLQFNMFENHSPSIREAQNSDSA